jgi:DHA2 family methylenomycin A resistance protein-like MFS transporter
VRGFSVLEAGLIFLPLTGTFLISNIISGKVQARVGSRIPMIVGGLIGATGYALLGLFGISESASFWSMLPGLALIPGGMGLGVPAMTTAILSSVDKSQSGTASAVLNTARQVGGATGVAIYGALIAGTDSAAAMHGIQIALVVSTLLLLGGAYLAWQYIWAHHAHVPSAPVTSGIE